MHRIAWFGLGLLLTAIVWVGHPPQVSAMLVLNEILANPGTFDANQDGTAHTSQDEFIELANVGANPLSLAGWKLRDATQVRHVFAAEASLPAWSLFTVFGGGTPSGFDLFATASAGGLGLNNTGDTVSLLDPSDLVIDTWTFGASDVVAGVSLTRFPDGTGAWSRHTTVSALVASAGMTVDGQRQLSALQAPVVPEPISLLLCGAGALGVVLSRHRMTA